MHHDGIQCCIIMQQRTLLQLIQQFSGIGCVQQRFQALVRFHDTVCGSQQADVVIAQNAGGGLAQ
ncbi:MAG: hypothetical protein R3E95_08830 [Thiolinea sp.]